MSMNGVSQANQTAHATQSAPLDQHGFGAMVRQMTPAAHNIPPGLQRKQEAGQEVKNWKLAGGSAQTDGMAGAGATAHGKKADRTTETDATAHGKKAGRTTDTEMTAHGKEADCTADTDATAHGKKADRTAETDATAHGKKADRTTATDSTNTTMTDTTTAHGQGHAKTDRALRSA